MFELFKRLSKAHPDQSKNPLLILALATLLVPVLVIKSAKSYDGTLINPIFVLCLVTMVMGFAMWIFKQYLGTSEHIGGDHDNDLVDRVIYRMRRLFESVRDGYPDKPSVIAVRKIGSRYYRIKMFVEEVPSDEYKGMDGVVNYVKNDPQDRRVNKFRFAGNDRRENAASIRKQTLKR